MSCIIIMLNIKTIIIQHILLLNKFNPFAIQLGVFRCYSKTIV